MSLVALVLLTLPCLHRSLHVFIIGDSVDRYMTEDWCDFKGDGKGCGGPGCTYWAEGSDIRPRSAKGQTTHQRCSIGEDSITFLHNYGTNPTRPYLSSGGPFANDPYAETPKRIPYAIDLFFQRFDPPDIVLYHGTQWDIQLVYEQQGTRAQLTHGDYDTPYSGLWNSSVARFEANMHARIDEVQAAVELQLRKLGKSVDSVNIGVRTAVWNEAGGRLLHAFNAVTRRLAKQRNITLFDIDNDVWGTVDWDYAVEKTKPILRDFIHPVPSLMMMLAQKLLGDMYTKALILRGNTSHVTIRPLWLGRNDPSAATMSHFRRVRLVQEESKPPRPELEYSVEAQVDLDCAPKPPAHVLAHSSKHVYLLLDQNATTGSVRRSGPIDSAMRIRLGLSLTDVLSLPHHEVNQIPSSKAPPSCLQHSSRQLSESDASRGASLGQPCALRTTEGVFYIFESDGATSSLRLAPNKDAVKAWGISEEEVAQEVDPVWISLFPSGPPVPDIYHESALLRLNGHKEVYAVVGGRKRLIESVRVMQSHGWDFDQVIVVGNLHDFERLPLGDPLQS